MRRCGICGVEMLYPLSLFGSRVWTHPDVVCVRPSKISRLPVRRNCTFCKRRFKAEPDAKGRTRETCSTDCHHALKSKRRLETLGLREKPKSNKKEETLRKKWQKKAIEQDERLNRRVA
jgi:hypothetical protein